MTIDNVPEEAVGRRTIVRRRRSRGFAIVPNEMLDDATLTLEERGALAWLLARHDAWEVRPSALRALWGVGRNKVYSILSALIDAGYVGRSLVRSEGRLIGYEYVVYDEPPAAPVSEVGPASADSPCPQNRDTVATVSPITVSRNQGHGPNKDSYQEPKIDDREDCARASGCSISDEAFALAEEIGAICGYADVKAWPPEWCGAPQRAQTMLDAGWNRTTMIAEARAVMGRKRDGPPRSISYFEKPFAKAHALQAVPLPTVVIAPPNPEVIHAAPARHHDPRSGLAAIDRLVAALQAGDLGSTDEDALQRLPPRSIRGP